MIETFMLRKTDAKQVCAELAKEGLIETLGASARRERPRWERTTSSI